MLERHEFNTKFHMIFASGMVAFKVTKHQLYLGVHLLEKRVQAHKDLGSGEKFTEEVIPDE